MRKIITVFAVLFAIGIVLVIVGAALGGLKSGLSYDGNFRTENKTFSAGESAAITALDIDIEYADRVIIKTHMQDTILVDYFVTSSSSVQISYDIRISGGVLNIHQDCKETSWLAFGFWDWGWTSGNRNITITIPNELVASLNLKAVSATVDISNCHFSFADMNSTSGTVNINNLRADGAFVLRSTSGSLHLENITVGGNFNSKSTSGSSRYTNITTAGDALIEGTSGSVTLNDVAAAGSITVNSSSGTLRLTDVASGGTLKTKVNSGSTNFDRVSAPILDISGSSGSIRGTGISSEKISIQGSSGGINITIAGEKSQYNIDASTSGGSCNVSNQTVAGSDKSVKVHTTSGGVKVYFSGTNF